jgi:peptidoglycan lytic transglycosylase F
MMRVVRIGAQDALPDLEVCWDGLIIFHSNNTPGAAPWRLIKAQIRQESAFNPLAQSPTGPIGLGQFTANTWMARRPGKDRRDVFEMAGAMVEEMSSLLKWATNHGVVGEAQYRYALGAYNQGQGNLGKAMILAANEGADPTEWGNIPHVLNDIIGPARTAECVQYVNNIMQFWAAYENPGVDT